MFAQRRSTLASDTVIGVFFSAVIAFGLAVVSYPPAVPACRRAAIPLRRYPHDHAPTDITVLAVLFVRGPDGTFEFFSYNRMLYIGLNPSLARAHRIAVGFYQYTFAGLLSLVVILSVWAVGVLLVTALLIVPAAAARNFSRSAGAMFWWAMLVGLSSAVVGLLVSGQPWAATTATGACIILAAFGWFCLSVFAAALYGQRR